MNLVKGRQLRFSHGIFKNFSSCNKKCSYSFKLKHLQFSSIWYSQLEFYVEKFYKFIIYLQYDYEVQ